MNKKLSTFDVLALGFMTFAFFLGAGNIIFPPLAGSMVGTEITPAILGFLITAVGLPLVTLIAVAKAGGGIIEMAKYLPIKLATALALVVFIIIGPSFATPRTALVAFEIGIKPFISEPGTGSLAIFSVAFFMLVYFISVSSGSLLDAVGKVITPLLIILLVTLAVGVMIHPLGEIAAPIGDYASDPFIKGFLEGYNTMDTFGALVFGMLIIHIIAGKGVTDKQAQYKYLTIAGSIAAAGLAFVYISLFYLGATSREIAPNVSNGGEIIALYVNELFGTYGQMLLSLVVVLACFTTAVGLISAMSDFLLKLMPKANFKILVVINCILCALVTNIGLSALITLSIPFLFVVYPIAIALVALTLLGDILKNKTQSYRFVLGISLIFGLLDGLKVAGVNMDGFMFIPLFDKGLAWLIPTTLSIIIAAIVFKEKDVVA